MDFRRRRSRSLGVASEPGRHLQEVAVQDFEVHPTYDGVPSPDRDDAMRSQGQQDGEQEQERQPPGDQRAVPDDPAASSGEAMAMQLAGTAVDAVQDFGGAEAISTTMTGHENQDGAGGMGQTSLTGQADSEPALIPDLPPGFQGDVPLGRAASAMGAGVGRVDAARSLNAIGNVLVSLKRMTSLEQQRSSSRSGTPTSDGLEAQLQQLSLQAAPGRAPLAY